MSKVTNNNENPAIIWFSGGVTSAVATKIALRKYRDVQIYYIETNAQDPDTQRFLVDCRKWFQHDIHIRMSLKYHNPIDVFRKRHYINGVSGAPCTYYLKKKVRYSIEDEIGVWDAQVFGFDISERKRAQRFKEQYPNARAVFPLIDEGLSKSDCMAILRKNQIEIPQMYRLGFRNNNCIGCVKGGKGYWNAIREHFPDKFTEMAQLEREIGASCIKGTYLDELEFVKSDPIVESCSIFCEIEMFEESKNYGKG